MICVLRRSAVIRNRKEGYWRESGIGASLTKHKTTQHHFCFTNCMGLQMGISGKMAELPILTQHQLSQIKMLLSYLEHHTNYNMLILFFFRYMGSDDGLWTRHVSLFASDTDLTMIISTEFFSNLYGKTGQVSS